MDINDEHIDFYDLIGKKLNHELLPEEEQLFDSLIQNSDNMKIYEDLKKVWQSTPIPSIEVDTEGALNKLNNRIIEESTSSSKNKLRPYYLWAASIALVIGAVIAFQFLNTTPQVLETVSVQTKNFTEPQTIALMDSSNLKVDINSEIKYPKTFGNKSREVSLSGRAFFDIAPNKEKPFTIHTEFLDVMVLGTSFYVHAEKGATTHEVSVITGIVKVTNRNNTNENITLRPGDKAIFNVKDQKLTKTTNEPNDFYWDTKLLKFSNTTMLSYVETLNKNCHTNLTIDKNLLNCPIKTTFKNPTATEIFEHFKAYGYTLTKEGGKTRISGVCQ